MWRKILSILILLAVVGCGSDGGWDMPSPIRTGIDPSVGAYSFNSRGCFSVVAESGKKYVLFASDCWRFDKILVEEGSFFYEWGDIEGGVFCNTKHCPTDGYAISGSFNSTTTASGTIKYASACRINNTESFEAVLKK